MRINGQNPTISSGQAQSLSLLSVLNLKDGQKVIGRIVSLSPGEAVLDLAGQMLSAKIEGNPPFMTPGAVLSFRVSADTQGKIQLKVLNPLSGKMGPDNASVISQQPKSLLAEPTAQSDEKGVQPIINALVMNDLPALPDNIATIARTIQNFQVKYHLPLEPETVAFVMSQQWPLTDGVLLTALLLQNRDLRNQLWNSLQQMSAEYPEIARVLADLKLNMEEEAAPIVAKFQHLNAPVQWGEIPAEPVSTSGINPEKQTTPMTGFPKNPYSVKTAESSFPEQDLLLINTLIQDLTNALDSGDPNGLFRQILAMRDQGKTDRPESPNNPIQAQPVNPIKDPGITENHTWIQPEKTSQGSPDLSIAKENAVKTGENVDPSGTAFPKGELKDNISGSKPAAEINTQRDMKQTGPVEKESGGFVIQDHSVSGKNTSPEAAPQKIFKLLEQNLDLQKALHNQSDGLFNLIPLLVRDSQNNLHECFVEWRSEPRKPGKQSVDQSVSFIIPTENMGLVRMTVSIGARTKIGLKVASSDVKAFIARHTDALRESISASAPVTAPIIISLDVERQSEPQINGVDVKL